MKKQHESAQTEVCREARDLTQRGRDHADLVSRAVQALEVAGGPKRVWQFNEIVFRHCAKHCEGENNRFANEWNDSTNTAGEKALGAGTLLVGYS